jgi:hypothetical protein
MCPASCATFDGYDTNCEAWFDGDCNDRQCNILAHQGKCKEDPDYMIPMCPEACLPTPFEFTENCESCDENEECSD